MLDGEVMMSESKLAWLTHRKAAVTKSLAPTKPSKQEAKKREQKSEIEYGGLRVGEEIYPTFYWVCLLGD